ncbi:NAD(P)/FAD-dependent oxidoreductase [Streptomyces sp. NPDC051567]|uniref:NAD(P)/FAD-dependent oxidoreductase n=1 Tax=Streptomyces sp. NPDC051567 TaxID=3365660 RepID=UPI0037B01F9B
MTRPTTAAPARVAVVGAGMVGLATAWFLQERGVDVTVHDRVGVAAGASWGNAGWLTPGMAAPLPEPAVLGYGLRALLSSRSPLSVPLAPGPRLVRFLTGFARNCTAARWRTAMEALVPVNRLALPGFDALGAGGVPDRTVESAVLAGYRTREETRGLLTELGHLHAAGQDIGFDLLTGTEARAAEPSLSEEIGAAVRLHGQRYLDPGAYVHGLAEAVRARGGELRTGVPVSHVTDTGTGVGVGVGAGTTATTTTRTTAYDAVVLATGAWLGDLARPFGVRTIVQAGRGYSFSVAVDRVPAHPLYFPSQRVACTPMGDRLRIAGMMDFRSPDAPLDRRRTGVVADSVRPLLRAADLDARQDEWAGSRPCTPDGLPLIGATRSPRVFVAGGHGMWGITLGPATGRLLAEQIVTGRRPAELAPFDPLR